MFLFQFDDIFVFYFIKKQALAISHMTITLQILSDNRKSPSCIGVVHIPLILIGCYSADEQVEHEVNCWMIAATFSKLSTIENMLSA
jgi:hypothetical protein